MRKLTNRNNLPQTLVDAISDDQHWLGGDISVTTLIDAPQIRMLRKNNTVEEDVMDKMWATLGTGVHAILERSQVPSSKRRAFMVVVDAFRDLYKEALELKDEEAAAKTMETGKFLKGLMNSLFPQEADRYLFEHRMVTEMAGWKVSGTSDLYEKAIFKVWDYKVCSVYQYKDPEGNKKWKQQLNIYAYKLRRQGYRVDKISVVAIFRDFSGAAQLRDPYGYPPAMTVEIVIDVMKNEDIEKLMLERIAIHKRAQAGEQIDCAAEDRWTTPDTFAIMRPGKARSIKNFGDNFTAMVFLGDNKHLYPDAYIEHRPGEFGRRCLSYCDVKNFCPQYKQHLETLK